MNIFCLTNNATLLTQVVTPSHIAFDSFASRTKKYLGTKKKFMPCKNAYYTSRFTHCRCGTGARWLVKSDAINQLEYKHEYGRVEIHVLVGAQR